MEYLKFTHILQIGILMFSITIQITNTEIFTSIAEMEVLLETESALITILQGYIDVQETKIDNLKKKLYEYEKEHIEAAADVSLYLSNPINAYLLTKRLTSDWKQLENFMSHDVGDEYLKNITNYQNVLKFPSDEDLNGAAVALIRLQDTYKLPTENIARGELNGVQYSKQLSSNDCFELGRQSYFNNDYHHTISWMNEAMSRLTTEAVNQSSSISRADILDYLSYSTYMQGNVTSALMMTDELLELVPNHVRALQNRDFYLKKISELKKDSKLKGDDGSDVVDVAEIPITIVHNPFIYDSSETKLYEMLCRQEIQPTPEQLRPLRCRYIDNNKAYLKIAPFKIEEVSMSPYIVVYHEVMYDNEIEVVKKMAKPLFTRAGIFNSGSGGLDVANYRISKSAWLNATVHKYIPRIERRVGDMTGLDMTTSEELQVVNYGIGGHYESHFDFAPDEEEIYASRGFRNGNRIATVLFYMSDVEQGGATVFPYSRTAVWPKKGTAAVWFNMLTSGEKDYRTRHAGCPVLTGTKWVSNIWIHERGQEFIRKCELEPEPTLEHLYNTDLTV